MASRWEGIRVGDWIGVVGSIYTFQVLDIQWNPGYHISLYMFTIRCPQGNITQVDHREVYPKEAPAKVEKIEEHWDGKDGF